MVGRGDQVYSLPLGFASGVPDARINSCPHIPFLDSFSLLLSNHLLAETLLVISSKTTTRCPYEIVGLL